MSKFNSTNSTTDPVLAMMVISDYLARSGTVKLSCMQLTTKGLLMPADSPVPYLQVSGPEVSAVIQKFNEMGLSVGGDDPLQIEDEGQSEVVIFIAGLGQIRITRAK